MSISGAEYEPLSADPHASKLANQGLIVLLICHFLLIVFTFRDYGMSWDQAPTREYGKTVVQFYSSFGRDTTARLREEAPQPKPHVGDTGGARSAGA